MATPHEEAQREVDAFAAVNKARAALDALKAQEEDYLKGREERERVRTAKLTKAASEALRILEEAIAMADRTISEAAARDEKSTAAYEKALRKIDDVLASAGRTYEKAKKASEDMARRDLELKKKERAASARDKELTVREEQAEEMAREGERKLKEAEDLVYWHHHKKGTPLKVGGKGSKTI